MFECRICGLLSLGGTACPACGSQLRTDLSTTGPVDEHLPTDVPGLDDAAAAWYDLEGIEPPSDEVEVEENPVPTEAEGGLPFGFQGASNVYASRLPFGIGSFADGIPFDAQLNETANGTRGQISSVENEPEDTTTSPLPSTTSDSVPQPEPETTPDAPGASLVEEPVEPTVDVVSAVEEVPITNTALPNLVVSELPMEENEVKPLMAAAPPVDVSTPVAPVRLETARLVEPAPTAPPGLVARVVQPAPVQEELPVPDYWRIDAQIPDYEEIYDHTESVVEMQYGSYTEDVVVFDHETDSPAAVFHSPLEATPVAATAPSILLALHPAQALNIDVGGDAVLQGLVNEGFASMQRGAWSESARAFQRLAASLPTSAEVFNNYGISLLQRAIGMRDGQDEQQRSLADAQFESAILALREAAKGAPTNGDILVNLACALIESGRSEKALGIMNVHNARTPNSAKGVNTAAVAMFNLGQLSQAAQSLEKVKDDSLVAQNLQKLTPSAGI